jgi:arginine-tRNA-protein transferase
MTTRIGPPIVDPRRVQMFNAHRDQRGMNQANTSFDETDYEQFLLDTCCDTMALDFYVKNELVAVAICDRGDQAWSAVYCFFDPQFGRLSPGTYAILKQIELCRKSGVVWLYLGFYIENCRHMHYKQVYRPNERLIEGQWMKFA